MDTLLVFILFTEMTILHIHRFHPAVMFASGSFWCMSLIVLNEISFIIYTLGLLVIEESLRLSRLAKFRRDSLMVKTNGFA